MPYFHGTHVHRLPGILKHGLGGVAVPDRNYPDAETGVYLSTDPVICVGVLIDHYITTGTPDSSPREHLASFRIIVIDDTRVDASKLRLDPSFEHATDKAVIYDGVIDVTGMPILMAEDVLPK